MILAPSNDALIDGIKEANSRLNRVQNYGIAVMSEGDGRFTVSLVDASIGDGRFLRQLRRVPHVPRRNVPHKIRQLKAELPELTDEPGDGDPFVFLLDDHPGEYRECWKSADPESLEPLNVGSKPIVVAYNRTIC